MISGEGDTINRGRTITNEDRTTMNRGKNLMHGKGIAAIEEDNR